MKYYTAGMFSLVLIPLILIPVFTKVSKERDLRILRLNMPTTNRNVDLEFSTYDFYHRIELDTLKLERMDLVSIEKQFDKLSCLRSDSVFLKNNKPNFKKGLMFKISSNTDYEDLVNLLNNCIKYDFKFFGLDLIKDNFVVYEIYNDKINNFEILDMGCIVKEEASKSKWENVLVFFEDVGIAFNGLVEFKSIIFSYLCLVVIFLGSSKNREKG